MGDVGIVVFAFGKLPQLNVVYRHAAHAHAACFAQYGDAAFEILRVSQHGHAHRAQSAIAPLHVEYARVFGFNVARGAGHGLHFGNGANEPVEQVYIVAGLVHKRAAVKLPCAAPAVALVVIALRARPKHVQMHHVDFAKAFFIYCALEQLQRGVHAVLLDYKQAHACFITGFNHAHAVCPARRHGLFAHHMHAVPRRQHGLLWVQAAGGAQGDQIKLLFLQHFLHAGVGWHLVLRGMGLQHGGVGVANGSQFQVGSVFFNRAKMVFGNAPAAYDGDADFSAVDAGKVLFEHGY